MAQRSISGNEAVVLGAVRAGAGVVTLYGRGPAAVCVSALAGQPTVGARCVESSSSGAIALGTAVGAACAGQRALCVLEAKAFFAACELVSELPGSALNAGLLIYVIEEAGSPDGEATWDVRGLARLCGLPVLEPATTAEAHRLAELAFDISEQAALAVVLCQAARVAASTALVEILDAALSSDDQRQIPQDPLRAAEVGAVPDTARHLPAFARLELAGQAIRLHGLNRLYLAPRAVNLGAQGGAVLPDPVPAQEARSRTREWMARLGGSHGNELVYYVQDVLYPLLQLRQNLPDPLQEVLDQAEERLRLAQECLHQAHELPRRQAEELLRYVDSALGEAAEALPHMAGALRTAQEVLRQLSNHVPEGEEKASQPVAGPGAQPGRLVLPVLDAPSYAGIGILASGASAACVDDGIDRVGGLLPPGWPPLTRENVSALRLAASNPFPTAEAQALLRHCHTVIMLEELGPHVERDLYVEAQRLEFDGQILGKLNGFFKRGRACGVSEAVRGLAAALDVSIPPP